MHEYTSQVKLYLETNVDIRSIERRDPPQREQLLGIWLRPEHCALVSFLYRIDPLKLDAFSQKRPSHVGKYIPCIPRYLPPKVAMTSIQ